MTLLHRILAALALAGALLGLSWGLWQTSKALSATRAQVATLSSQVEALQARTQRIQTQVSLASKAAQETRHALDQAIQADPADADQPTPRAVVDSLCKSLRCAQ